jgi:hypothetical protein
MQTQGQTGLGAIPHANNYELRCPMSTYIIIERGENAAMTHAAESREALACEIAKQLMSYPGSSDALMAVSETSPIASLAVLQSSALCALDLDDELEAVWREDAQQIYQVIQSFKKQVKEASTQLFNALDKLNEFFEQSETFENPELHDYISVADVMDGLCLDEIDYQFHESLQGTFKFRLMGAR